MKIEKKYHVTERGLSLISKGTVGCADDLLNRINTVLNGHEEYVTTESRIVIDNDERTHINYLVSRSDPKQVADYVESLINSSVELLKTAGGR